MEHGIFHISHQPRFLLIKLTESFNQEGSLAFTTAAKVAISELGPMPFALLFDITEFEGATPEAYQEIEALNIWLNTQKLIAKATVIKSRVQIAIANYLSPARKQQNTQHFYHHSDAQIWLTQELENHVSHV